MCISVNEDLLILKFLLLFYTLVNMKRYTLGLSEVFNGVTPDLSSNHHDYYIR